MPDMFQSFLALRTQIEVFALRRGLRSRERVAAQGHDLGELDPHALINAVWARILAGTTIWDPDKKPFFKFFCDEISNRVRSFEQKKPGLHLSIVSSADPAPNLIDPESLGRGDVDIRSTLERLETADLMHFIHQHDPDLALLAQAILDGFSIEEQARLINRTPSTRLRWENELVVLVRSFISQAEPLVVRDRPRARDE